MGLVPGMSRQQPWACWHFRLGLPLWRRAVPNLYRYRYSCGGVARLLVHRRIPAAGTSLRGTADQYRCYGWSRPARAGPLLAVAAPAGGLTSR